MNKRKLLARFCLFLVVLTATTFVDVKSTTLSVAPAPRVPGATQVGDTTQYGTCPDGTYQIGMDEYNQPICKSEPTGCPYGDSIALDSGKCEAPAGQSPAAPAEPKKECSL